MTESTAIDQEIVRRAEARVGNVVREKWTLDELLGMGGMASVYAATHRNGKRAALKILHAEAALAPNVKERFLREGYLANKVDHPGALSILDDDIDADGTVFLVMELLEGENLEQRWNRRGGRLEADEVLLITDQLLDVLVSAHDKGIVHRDIKPGNLFVEAAGTLKVLDFGIARLQSVAPSSNSTGGHSSLGTPGFMPPEQARGRWDEVDERSDLWAVGATMFALLTGRYVHEAATVNEQLLAAMTEQAAAVRDVVDDVPPLCADVVDRALSFAKDDRWPDSTTMQEGVRAAYEGITGQPVESAPRLPTVLLASRPSQAGSSTVSASEVTISEANAEQVRKKPSRSGLWLGLAAGLLLTVVVVFALRSPDDEELGVGAPQEAPTSPHVAEPVETVTQASAALPPAPSASPAEPEAEEADAGKPPPAAAPPAPTRVAPRPRPAVPEKPPESKPDSPEKPESVDIFERRK